MANGVFRDFDILPDVIGEMLCGGSLCERVLRLFSLCASEIAGGEYSAVCVQGDTASAFAGALAGFLSGVPVVHLEAGMRTYEVRSPFPEEMVRRSIGAMADLHFCTTEIAASHLAREGVSEKSVYTVGNTGEDTLKRFLRSPAVFPKSRKPHILLTLHRRETTDGDFLRLLKALCEGAEHGEYEIVFPIHESPRMKELTKNCVGTGWIRTPPLSPSAFVPTLRDASLVITDSGGVSEESAVLGIPTLVYRRETERTAEWKSGRISLFSREGDPKDEIRRGLSLPRLSPAFHNPSPSKTVADILIRRFYPQKF